MWFLSILLFRLTNDLRVPFLFQNNEIQFVFEDMHSLQYQLPLVGRLTGISSLIRWNHSLHFEHSTISHFYRDGDQSSDNGNRFWNSRHYLKFEWDFQCLKREWGQFSIFKTVDQVGPNASQVVFNEGWVSSKSNKVANTIAKTPQS